MYSFDYDYDNAQKAIEIQKVRNIEMLFGSAVGAFAVYKTGPIRKEMARSYGMMRKAWMRYPLPVAIFLFSYHCAISVP